MIKVIIADNHPGMREAWRFILSLQDGVLIVAVCSNGQEVIDLCRKLEPDIVLMDINMEPMTGFEATSRLLQTHPQLKIIGISIHADPSYAQEMLKIGGRGFITKSSSSEEMMKGILAAISDKNYICSEVRSRMNSDY